MGFLAFWAKSACYNVTSPPPPSLLKFVFGTFEIVVGTFEILEILARGTN